MANPKVRPSFTIADMLLMAEACEYKLQEHVKASDFANPSLLHLDRVAKYCRTFAVQEESMESLFTKFLAAQTGKLENGGVELGINPTNIVPAELTDEQRYDLLKLKPAKQYSEEDKAFFLNKGTMIEFSRMNKTEIKTGDL